MLGNMVQTKIFIAAVEHLHEMLLFILGLARQVGFKPAALGKIELACEEAIVNVIEHAYQDRGGDLKISVEAKAKKEIVITLADQGEAFDPLAAAEPADLSSPLEEREVGGLGIHFIRKCLDEVSYRREDDWNILTLIKKVHLE